MTKVSARNPAVDAAGSRGGAVRRVRRTPLGWATPAFVCALASGLVVLRLGGTARGNELSADRAVFTAVNAITLTGFQATMGVDAFALPGKLAVLGLTVAGTLLALIVGAAAVARVLRLPHGDGRIARVSVAATLAAALLGGVVLLSPTRDLLASMLLGVGALGNSGLYAGRLPEVTSASTQLLLLPLATLGGLGITVLIELWDRIRGRHCLSRHAQAVLWTTAGVYLAAFVALHLVGLDRPTASTLALNARTLGLPFAAGSDWPRLTPWIVAVVMAIGASPGGTGGGIKTTTLVALTGGVRRALRGEAPGRITGIAAVWLLSYAGVVFATFLALLSTEPQAGADQLLFLAVSAASNVGLSADPVSIVGPGLYALSAAMLLGRVLPLVVLWWAATTVDDAELAVG
ncbi:MAG TPA: hypothetical protein VK324_01590 [Tepidisphaeraceae bacterium]|nr:hypothetical protein [Tepidisphaeraceae bacterium]